MRRFFKNIGGVWTDELTGEKLPVLSSANVRDDVKRFAKQIPPEPTIAELATNFAGAMSRWAAGGFAVLDRAGYDARAAVCDACEFWDGAARLGLGKCGAPGCGCTGMKRWLATEKCPQSKWP